MSLFVCSKCGCIDNTATSYYWFLIRPCIGRIYDESLKGYEGKPLCSECAAIGYDKEDQLVVVFLERGTVSSRKNGLLKKKRSILVKTVF